MKRDKQLLRGLLWLHVPPLLALLAYAAVELRPEPPPIPPSNNPALQSSNQPPALPKRPPAPTGLKLLP